MRLGSFRFPRAVLGLASAALLLGGAALGSPPGKDAVKIPLRWAKGKRPDAVPAAPVTSRTPSGVGTIQYDNDTPFSRDGTGLGVGNRFNNGFQDPHSVATVTFRRGGAAGTTAAVAIIEVPLITTMALGSGQLTGLPPSTSGSMVWVLPLQNPVLNHSGPFIAGLLNDYQGSCAGNTMLGAPCDGVALTQGTMDPGMGFHAVRVLPVFGTLGQDIPNRNAIFRVTGNNLPVELMDLAVE